ncbi:MAG: hypothetical protein JRH18_22790 [Deltaproteobacteria bacterium]|nr:hypothetical protein [Deltaproteobacteria bacterium]MBW1963147.1 hypothetical protein [Deltaproteobacteria bacterium]MBW1992880.1 hypothetical protein [Deltaproteobacteria bacterium]MBW2154475.1 hypothetical protein [Deltaproteobacteria bacterium]
MSIGGFRALKGPRKVDIRIKGDQRILGSSDFVENVLKPAKEELKQKYDLIAKAYDFFKRTLEPHYRENIYPIIQKYRESAFVEIESQVKKILNEYLPNANIIIIISTVGTLMLPEHGGGLNIPSP